MENKIKYAGITKVKTQNGDFELGDRVTAPSTGIFEIEAFMFDDRALYGNISCVGKSESSKENVALTNVTTLTKLCKVVETDIITNDLRTGRAYYVYEIVDGEVHVQEIKTKDNPTPKKFIWEGEFIKVSLVHGEYDKFVDGWNFKPTSTTNYKLIEIKE